MPLKKKQWKTKFLKCDSLCMIAKLEKGSYSDRRLPDVYGENTSGIHLQPYDSWKKLVEDIDEGKVKEAGSCRTFASQMGGPSWSDNRFVACRFGHVVVMGVVKIE